MCLSVKKQTCKLGVQENFLTKNLDNNLLPICKMKYVVYLKIFLEVLLEKGDNIFIHIQYESQVDSSEKHQHA